jgi:hypothetical protein
MAALVMVCALGCKGEKKNDPAEPAAGGEKAAPAEATAPGAAKEAPALPSIGDDPSPVKICARLAAAAAAEGGEGETNWKVLAPECEKNLADAATSRTEKYMAFADCMRDKTTFTAVMNDCKQLE